MLSNLIKNLRKTLVAQIILYYHVTKQFFSYFNYFIKCIQFQNIFWRNISCFRLWWKIYTKRCTNTNVTSRIKRLSSPALCTGSISEHDLEMEERRVSKNIELKIWRQKFRFWFWFLFTLLTFSCLYCCYKLLLLLLDCFSLFLTLVSTFRSYYSYKLRLSHELRGTNQKIKKI